MHSSGPSVDTLPESVRGALLYGTDLVFFEFAGDAVADPVALASRNLGMYFQGFSRGLHTPAGAAEHLNDLRGWLDADLVVSTMRRAAESTTLADFAADLLDAAFLAASVSFARAILYATAGADERVPAAVQPYLAYLQPMIERLTEKRASGDQSAQEAHLIFPWLEGPSEPLE